MAVPAGMDRPPATTVATDPQRAVPNATATRASSTNIICVSLNSCQAPIAHTSARASAGRRRASDVAAATATASTAICSRLPVPTWADIASARPNASTPIPAATSGVQSRTVSSTLSSGSATPAMEPP